MRAGNGVKYIFLYGAFLIYSLSTIFARYAGKQDILVRVLFFMGLEVVCLGVYAIIWQQVLKRFPLATAMSSKGIVVIFNMLLAFLLFREAITVYNIAGAVIILIGIRLVAADD